VECSEQSVPGFNVLTREAIFTLMHVNIRAGKKKNIPRGVHDEVVLISHRVMRQQKCLSVVGWEVMMKEEESENAHDILRRIYSHGKSKHLPIP